MKIIDVSRGTPEWHQARRGKVTAGMLHAIFASDRQRRKYAGRLALDILGDDNHEDHEAPPPWIQSAEENRARCLAAWARRYPTAVTVTPGLVVSSRHDWFATSPAAITTNEKHLPAAFLLATTETSNTTRWDRINAGLEAPLQEPAASRIQAQLFVTELPMAMLLVATTTSDGQWLMTERPIYPDPAAQRRVEETALIFRLEVLMLAKQWRHATDTSRSAAR